MGCSEGIVNINPSESRAKATGRSCPRFSLMKAKVFEQQYSSVPIEPSLSPLPPTQSSAKATGLPSKVERCSATGLSCIFRPARFWPTQMRSQNHAGTLLKCVLNRGSEASIRVSATFPPLIGTLKSTRTKTRLPLRSSSLIESFALEIGVSALYFVLVR